MIASKPKVVTKPQLMASLSRQTFKEIEVFEPLNDDTLKLIKSLRKDDKATVLILRSR